MVLGLLHTIACSDRSRLRTSNAAEETRFIIEIEQLAAGGGFAVCMKPPARRNRGWFTLGG